MLNVRQKLNAKVRTGYMHTKQRSDNIIDRNNLFYWSKSYATEYSGILTRTMDALLKFYIAGQNPTLIITRGILTRTMDTLLTFYIAGQNPTRVKIPRNRPHFVQL